MASFLLDRPCGSYRAAPIETGGHRVEIELVHGGASPLIDLFQEAPLDRATLLHPQEAPGSFRCCLSDSTPGWTCLGEGVMPGERIGPFVAWCAEPPAIFTMCWQSEDPEIGGTFEVPERVGG